MCVGSYNRKDAKTQRFWLNVGEKMTFGGTHISKNASHRRPRSRGRGGRGLRTDQCAAAAQVLLRATCANSCPSLPCLSLLAPKLNANLCPGQSELSARLPAPRSTSARNNACLTIVMQRSGKKIDRKDGFGGGFDSIKEGLEKRSKDDWGGNGTGGASGKLGGGGVTDFAAYMAKRAAEQGGKVPVNSLNECLAPTFLHGFAT